MNEFTRYVVDASVGLKWVLPEEDSESAEQLLREEAAGRALLIAPDLYVNETANAIWKRCRLRNEIGEGRAREALHELQELLPALVPSRALVTQALDLALAFRRPIYDCLYVALAIRDSATLVTADGPLLSTFGSATARVTHIRDLDFA